MSDETPAPTPKKTGKKSSKTAAPVEVVATPAPNRRARVFRFEQWAARRGRPQHHHGGLRAYVKNSQKPRTLEEWDKCFENY